MTDGDLISRDYVLSKFKEQCDRCGKYKENNGVICRCCALDDAIGYVEDAPSAEKMARWISISERLPEYDEDIIITHIGSMGQPITSVSYYDGDFRTEDGEGYFSDVIAWAPLPEPYNAEKTAELRIVGETTMHYECSLCGGAVDKWDKFCKHCGARMKGEQTE